MRNLTINEIGFISGAGEYDHLEPKQCEVGPLVGNQDKLLENLIGVYEATIAFAVYVAERVIQPGGE